MYIHVENYNAVMNWLKKEENSIVGIGQSYERRLSGDS